MIEAGSPLYASGNGEWGTPNWLFEELNKEFGFTLDPCATAENAKCETYFTKEDDGLAQDWRGHTVFMNPPYGRDVGEWIKKAHEEAWKIDTIVVGLLPARTDTAWFHDYVYKKTEVRFLKGRIKFLIDGEQGKNSAPFPSMVVIWR